VNLAGWQLLLVDLLVIGCLSLVIGYAGHRMPDRWFDRESWLTRARRFEDDGRFYVRVLRIKRWKDALPEAGALFAGGFDKKHLRATDVRYLLTHARETRRAELVHWLHAGTGLPLLLWNPVPVAAAVSVAMVLFDTPFIAAQRYNRIRLARIVRLRTREP
jgi:glycosyl-4,4'-diaponeurosporenoate acyltransferase